MKFEKLTSYQNLIIVASVLPIIIFGFLTYYESVNSQTQKTFEYLQNTNTEQKEVVLDYFKTTEFNTKNLVQTLQYLQKKATNSIKNIQKIQKDDLINFYHHAEKDLISLSQKDIFQYIFSFLNRGKSVAPQYLGELLEYQKDIEVKNILMINRTGNIVYSSQEPQLVHKNIRTLTPSFKEAWKEIKNLKHKSTHNVYFVPLGYDNNTHSYKQFAITPFKDVKGFIAIELDTAQMNQHFQDSSFFGKNTQTYLIQKHKGETYLASQRLLKNGKIGDKKSGAYIDLGFYSTGVASQENRVGKIELVGYTPVHIRNLHFSMQTILPYMESISPIINGSNFFERYVSNYKYKNLLMISKEGRIFYSVKKESMLGVNIFDSEYEDSTLLKAIEEVFISKKFLLTDIEAYPSDKHTLTQFALMPILNEEKDIETIVVLLLDIHRISELLATKSSIFKTSETYLVGADYKLRSDSLLQPEKYNILTSYTKDTLIKTQAVKKAFQKEQTNIFTQDYRNKDVLSSFSLLTYQNLNWAILTEVDKAEEESTQTALKHNIYIFVLISSLVALFMMLLITNEKKKNDKKLHYSALHDDLTKLPNRRYIVEFLTFILTQSKRNHRKGAILFMDLDKFKTINDTYGHEAGDTVLLEVAKRLKKSVREKDLVARLGGDEFLIVIDGYETTSDIDTVCQKLLTNISEPIIENDKRYSVGLSIGISTFPDDANNTTTLLSYADTAMYKTKDNGHNGYTFYSKEMMQESLHTAQIEQDLKEAIYTEQLELYYQPQINIKTKKIVGTEALVRWNHPQEGFVMPDKFIPIAEKTNLIVELGYWVLERACHDFLSWQKQGYEMEYVAVNMSSRQLQSPDCVTTVKNILDKLSFNAKQLELEITETTLISNFEGVIKNMNAFKEMGIKFSIDDFGTGYSSLSYLKTLQISTLKIDREFIKDILTDRDDRTIVTAIIAMGHALGYTIIAEGAETLAEVELLKYLACDIVQGYYYSKPLPQKKLLEFIDAQ